LETLLFFIIECVLPKNPYKNSDSKQGVLTQGISSNINSVYLPNSQNEFKNKALNDGNLQGINKNTIAKATLEGINETLFKNSFEKFLDYPGMKREKYDFLSMIKSSRETQLTDRVNLINSIYNTTINKNEIQLSHKNLKNPLPSPFMQSMEFPKMELEDNSLLYTNSPNPFLEDMAQTNFFNPSNISENFTLFSRQESAKQKDENENNLINNNFPTRTRNNSIDLSDLFKNNSIYEEELVKKIGENNNYLFDDSYFSVSSGKNKSQKNDI
jgi:hypothetical protein